MRIDTVSHLATNDQQRTTHILSADESREPHVMEIEPDDALEAVLIALRLLSGPIIVLLPEESQAFNDPSHFVRLREICTPSQVSFVIPPSRLAALPGSAQQHGLALGSSLPQAAQLVPAKADVSQEKQPVESTPDQQPMGVYQQTRGSNPTTVAVDPKLADLEEQEISGPRTAPIRWPSQSAPPLPKRLSLRGTVLKRSRRKRLGLIATLIALFVAASVVLLPGLFSGPSGLTGITQLSLPQATTVGQITFTSSGQLDPTSSKRLNDMLMVSLHTLSTPAPGNSLFVWLLPDPTDDTTLPRLLGKLAITGGKAQLMYIDPNHDDLLASYSGFRVTEQPSNAVLTTPPLDPKAWRYGGSVPDIPTPGDEKQYSLLKHIRHLLAKDPTLQDVGLAGGLDTWLDRNS